MNILIYWRKQSVICIMDYECIFIIDPDAGKHWGQEEKGAIDDEIVGWHHWLNEHEFGWTPGVSDGQRSLGCCSPWGSQTVRHDWATNLKWYIPNLGLYPGKNMVGRDTCTPMVTAALFTMSKTWTQARCTSTDKEIKEDVVYLYNGTLVIKKNKIMTFATT